ncbi:MAG TPA: hypothetical protein VMU50_03520 [Polyangia bacterium]|nr:hypothetical protein [Polyangia bacterium]
MDRLADRSPDDGRRTLLQRLPRRNLRRALFLLLALLAVLAIKRSGGLRLGSLFDSMAPPPAPAPAYRLHVEPPAAAKPN